MEWNAKSPGQWDWETLFFLNAKTAENPKFQPTVNWNGEADRGINVGVLYPSAGGGSEFEQTQASSSRSSKSASNNSSSNWDSKTSMLTQEGSQDDSTGKKELCKGEPVGTSPAAEPYAISGEPYAISGEPLLTLKLGKRFYFEDVCLGIDSKKSSSSGIPLSRGKKCKSACQNLPSPNCQVEGCGLDLSSAKDYHRKHRVCESHSKSPKVVIAGLERRFCQQCSRFHAMSEFDDKKRSCRRRLSDHNARRRKPQPGAVQLNPSAPSLSTPYAGMHAIGPFAFSRNATNNVWQDLHSSKLPETKDFILKPTKAFHKMPNAVAMLSNDSSTLLTTKGIGTKSIFPGIEDPDATSHDVNGALSLLSTNSWDTYENKSLSLQHSTNRTTGTTQSAITQCIPFPLSEYWHATDHQPANSNTCISYSGYDNGNRIQDFQLFSEPFESGFPCNQLD